MNKLLHIIGIHDWEYRNPYDRTCLMCHKHQQAFCNMWDLYREYNEWRYTWWEDVE